MKWNATNSCLDFSHFIPCEWKTRDDRQRERAEKRDTREERRGRDEWKASVRSSEDKETLWAKNSENGFEMLPITAASCHLEEYECISCNRICRKSTLIEENVEKENEPVAAGDCSSMFTRMVEKSKIQISILGMEFYTVRILVT